MSMSCIDAGPKPVHRFEVFTGSGVRRSWTSEEKAAIVAESYAGDETVCAVARRHGLRHSQLFTWRREMRVAAGESPARLFVPAVIEPSSLPAIAGKKSASARRRAPRRSTAAVELEIDGVCVKIGRGAEAGVIAAVIDALKTTR